MSPAERRYGLIEPNIDPHCNWELNIYVRALEVIRKELPGLIPECPEAEYDLLLVTNMNDGHNPSLGVHCRNDEICNSLPEILEIESRIENWIKIMCMDWLIEKAQENSELTWPLLISEKILPKR